MGGQLRVTQRHIQWLCLTWGRGGSVGVPWPLLLLCPGLQRAPHITDGDAGTAWRTVRQVHEGEHEDAWQDHWFSTSGNTGTPGCLVPTFW